MSDTSIPVNFTNNSIENVLSYLETVTGVSIYVDWRALELVGINRDDEITLQLAEVTASTALARILEQLGPRGMPAPSPPLTHDNRS